MRRSNGKQLRVDAPSKGLQKDHPPDLQDDRKKRYLTAASNVRAADGTLHSAPGYERIHVEPENVDSPVSLLHQPNIVTPDLSAEGRPIVGTEKSVYLMRKGSRTLPSSSCEITFAALSDSGNSTSSNAKGVADLIKGWSPDVVVHAGDLIYSSSNGGNTDVSDDLYETQVGQRYWWAIGGYNGPYGQGPSGVTRFLPTPGNHDFDDGDTVTDLARYFEFFSRPSSPLYYDVKIGPVHFFFVNSYGYGPNSGETGPGGSAIAGTGATSPTGDSDLSSTGTQGSWLQTALGASDCPFRVVVWHHPPATSENTKKPGYSVMDWPLYTWGADLLICGHSHMYERINMSDGHVLVTVGTGGHSLRSIAATAVSGSQAYYDDDYGALKVSATATALNLQFYSQDETLRDSATINVRSGRSLTKCYVANLAKGSNTLEVSPATLTLFNGQKYPLTAKVTHLDGTVEDVSKEAVWSSSAEGFATVTQEGVVEVTSVGAGSATITAEYDGLTDTSVITTEATCADADLDLMLVLDRSGSMLRSSKGDKTRLDHLKEAVTLLIESLDVDDRVGAVEFGGSYINQSVDSRLIASPQKDHARLVSVINKIRAYGDTGIAHALRIAQRQLTSEYVVKEGNRRVIILFTDGYANVSQGGTLPGSGSYNATTYNDAESAVDSVVADIKDTSLGEIFLMVVGLGVGRMSSRKTVLQNWASSYTPSGGGSAQAFWSVDDASELPKVFSELIQSLCRDIMSVVANQGIGTSSLPGPIKPPTGGTEEPTGTEVGYEPSHPDGQDGGSSCIDP